MKRLSFVVTVAVFVAIALLFGLTGQTSAQANYLNMFRWHIDWNIQQADGTLQTAISGIADPAKETRTQMYWEDGRSAVVYDTFSSKWTNRLYADSPYWVYVSNLYDNWSLVGSGVYTCGYGMSFDLQRTEYVNRSIIQVAAMNWSTKTMWLQDGYNERHPLEPGGIYTTASDNQLYNWLVAYDGQYGGFCGEVFWQYPTEIRIGNANARGDIVLPIQSSDLTNNWVLSYQGDLVFDPAVMSFKGFDSAGTMSAGFQVTTNEVAPGRVRFAAANPTNMKGYGTLINAKFTVTGTAGTQSFVSLENFMFDEGWPEATIYRGAVTVASGYVVSGHIRYGVTYGYVEWQPPLSGVTVTVIGPENVRLTTDIAGMYSATVNTPGSYVITASQSGNDAKRSVTAYDAAMALQCATYRIACSLISADVTNDGYITAYDAAQIARYIVGLTTTTTIGSWKFGPPNSTVNVVGDTVVNFNGVIVGDISENWPWAKGNAPTSANPAPDVVFGSPIYQDGYATVSLTIKRNVGAMQSANIVLNYDDKALELVGIETSWSLVTNGKQIVLYDIGDFEIPMTLKFKVNGPAKLAISSLTINEEAPFTPSATSLISQMSKKIYLPLIKR